MLVTALAAAIVAVSCTPTSETTTTAAASATTTVETPTTEPPIRTGIGVDDGVIRVGVLVPLSGPAAVFGESVVAGHTAFWTYVNETLGGVGGEYEVEVTVFDHRYDVDDATGGFNDLSGRVVGFAGALGSPIDEALAPLLEESGMLMMAGSLSSEWIGHSALVPNLMLPTYRDQVASGLAWAADGGLAGETAILYQEGSYGEDCLRGYDAAVSDLRLASAGRVAHAPASTDFGDVVEQLRASEPDLVVVCTTADALVRIVATADSLGFNPNWLVAAQSFDAGVATALGGDEGVEAGIARLGRVGVMGAGPPDGAPAASLMRSVFEGSDATDWYTLFGYSQAATFHLILEEAFESSDLTRAGLREAAARLDGIDLGLDGPLSSLVRPAPVEAAAVGRIDLDTITAPFGIPATEPYFTSVFAVP